MDNQNTGSFMGPAGGGGDAIAEAMARRNMGGSPTAASSMSQTPTPAPIPAGAPSAMPAGSGAPAPTTAGAPVAGLPPMPAESELIIKALDSRLKTLSKIEESKNVPSSPL